MTAPPIPVATSAGEITFRLFDPNLDYEPAAELVRTTNAHDRMDYLPSAATLAHEFAHDGNFRPAIDAIVAEVTATPASFVGLATATWRQRGEKVVHQQELWVRPDHRRRGIGTALLRWTEQHAADRARAGEAGPPGLPQELGLWGIEHVPGHAELAAANGYRIVRYGLEMLRPVADPIPDAPLPAGLEVRPVRPDDHRRIWEADVEAFRDHWEAPVRTENDFDWWFSSPIVDTTLWQVAWDGDEVAGSVFTSVDPEENEQLGVNRAWLGHISVRRPWRKRGLASSLIASTLRLLRERGFEEAALGVDAENPHGAVRVYERMGFRSEHTAANYRKPLEA
jgi:mycothiol synthase